MDSSYISLKRIGSRMGLRAAKRVLKRSLERGHMKTAYHPGTLSFVCNVCSTECAVPVGLLERETASCSGCGSTVRMRAVVDALSRSIYGESRVLSDFPVDKGIRGVGMSDWAEYADRLQSKFDYINTFYHQEPRLDITDIETSLEGTMDFVISSDVFEHVTRPVSRAFVNTRRLLKPGGVFVCTVPYSKEGTETKEHFPVLDDFNITESDGRYRLVNTNPSGEVEIFEELIFHGGPGQTLEMRVFSEASVLRELENAGFSRIEILRAPVWEYGIYWPLDWSLPIVAVR